MKDTLDLSLLDSGNNEYAIVHARCGNDFALGRLPFDKDLALLKDFRDRIEKAIRGFDSYPKRKDLEDYGQRLFTLAIRDDVLKLYNTLPPESAITVQLFSNNPDLQQLPWEYLQEPNQLASPRRGRPIVRLVPNIGYKPPPPIKISKTIRVLFVSAAPVDQGPVEFDLVKGAIKRTFQAKMPDKFEFLPVDGANTVSFRTAVAQKNYDILHFSGHGDVSAKGTGRLILVNRDTKRSEYLESEDFSKMISGIRKLRLVVLSACVTSAGDFRDNFAVISQALVRSGIPAVVANQLPVLNKSIAPFIGALYQELLLSGDIDQAMDEGRIALDLELRQASPDAVLEWGIPTLYRHCGAAQLYKP